MFLSEAGSFQCLKITAIRVYILPGDIIIALLIVTAKEPACSGGKNETGVYLVAAKDSTRDLRGENGWLNSNSK